MADEKRGSGPRSRSPDPDRDIRSSQADDARSVGGRPATAGERSVTTGERTPTTAGGRTPTSDRGSGDDTTRRAKDTVRETAREARDEIAEGTERIKHEARSTARSMREGAEHQADRWTTSMGEHTHHLARALEAAADRLRQDGERAMADMAGEAARQVDRMGGYLEDENPSEMLEDFEDLGRDNPGVFLGSAFTVGLMAGRLLRASRSNGHDGGFDGGERRVPGAGERSDTVQVTDRRSSPATRATVDPGHTMTGTERSDITRQTEHGSGGPR